MDSTSFPQKLETAAHRPYLRHSSPHPSETPRLDRGWIIANHKLVSFHAAFLTSLLSISPSVTSRFDVIRQMFLSAEVVISGLMWYAGWHCNIAIHEIGHYLAAVKTNNLRPELADRAQQEGTKEHLAVGSGISRCL